VNQTKGLSASFTGQPFGTYVVEWKHRRTAGEPGLALEILETETAVAGVSVTPLRRLSLSARPQDAELVEYALLRLGDRPETVTVEVRAAGAGEAESSINILPLAFPSDNLIRIPSLYRGTISDEMRSSPPAVVDLFLNVEEDGDPHATRWADPFAFINGRMLEKEDSLLEGKWFGSGNFFLRDNYEKIPSWIDIKLPQKKVITHVAIAEDPTLPRADTISVDAYIESREMRKGLSDFEKRQLSRGFWHNAIKSRGNTNVYNVYKFEKPIFTRHVRVYVVRGSASINEVELYGAIPQPAATQPATTQPASTQTAEMEG